MMTTDDTEARLERHYRLTWLCKLCGRRNPLDWSVCECDEIGGSDG